MFPRRCIRAKGAHDGRYVPLWLHVRAIRRPRKRAEEPTIMLGNKTWGIVALRERHALTMCLPARIGIQEKTERGLKRLRCDLHRSFVHNRSVGFSRLDDVRGLQSVQSLLYGCDEGLLLRLRKQAQREGLWRRYYECGRGKGVRMGDRTNGTGLRVLHQWNM